MYVGIFFVCEVKLNVFLLFTCTEIRGCYVVLLISRYELSSVTDRCHKYSFVPPWPLFVHWKQLYALICYRRLIDAIIILWCLHAHHLWYASSCMCWYARRLRSGGSCDLKSFFVFGSQIYYLVQLCSFMSSQSYNL